MSNKEKIMNYLQLTDPNNPILTQIWHMIHCQDNIMGLGWQIEGSILSCKHGQLDLSNKEKILAIFRCFLQSERKVFDRHNLIENIYANNADRLVSRRQQACLQHNIVKLLSRARSLARKTFFLSNGIRFDWFPYDPSSKTWQLVKIHEG